MAGLPTGTVTFLFTDIEGSTRLWERDASAMKSALARHDEILQSAIEITGGSERYEAVRLFAERARAIKPGFVLDGDAPAVAEICARLDGLPLAIELAAARTRLLPPKAILKRLGDRLKLLTGGARDLPGRQQTLRGAIDWSHDLLGEEDRRLFRRMSVFSGGRTLDAMEVICGTEGDLDVYRGSRVAAGEEPHKAGGRSRGRAAIRDARNHPRVREREA